MVCASGFSASAVVASFGVYGWLSLSAMPYACLVASMFFWMYGVSLACSFGLTWNCCTIAGYTPPISTADSAISPKPISAGAQVRRTGVRKNSTAQMIATKNRMVLAGRNALASTYRRPVQPSTPLYEPDFTASPYRSSQYATAFSSTKIPSSTARWPCAPALARRPGPCSRRPP